MIHIIDKNLFKDRFWSTITNSTKSISKIVSNSIWIPIGDLPWEIVWRSIVNAINPRREEI